MNTLAVSLFFSAGLPLLMPFAALALALTYCIDKVTSATTQQHQSA